MAALLSSDMAGSGGGLFGAWTQQQLSDLAGTASFVVWLFAQSPQLYENYRNSSCEGLSIVFLIQWMAGDATNLVGSVLTQQLPFQIAVATYFCCIDVCILLQYYYYWRRDQRIAAQQARLARRYEHAFHRARAYDTMPNLRMHKDDALAASAMLERGTSVQSTRSTFATQHQNPERQRTMSSSIGPSSSSRHQRTRSGSLATRAGVHPPRRRLTSDLDSNYRALGEAAKSVAELANETDRRMAAREARWRRAWAMALAEGAERRSAHAMRAAVEQQDVADNDDEQEDDNVPAHMTDSITSLSSRGSDGDHRFGFASTPNMRQAGSTPSSPGTGKRRGRDMRRTAGLMEAMRLEREIDENGGGGDISEAPQQRSRKNSGAGASSPIGRFRPSLSRSSTRGTLSPLSARQSGMVLLGLTALFAYSGGPSMSPTTAVGRPQHVRVSDGVVFGAGPRSAPDVISRKPAVDLHYLASAHPNSSQRWLLEQHPRVPGDGSKPPSEDPHYPHNPHTPPPPPTWERTIGRISAWTCTILYVTSRLPQIWINLQRRSVQGLSILLFVAAATGNLLYTLSILLNPRAQSPPNTPQARTAYLMESLPFLLGSGGTLVFDAIIVSQWLAWRGKPPLGETDGGDRATAPTTAAMLPSTGSYLFSPPSDRRTRKTSARSQWHSLERQPLLE